MPAWSRGARRLRPLYEHRHERTFHAFCCLASDAAGNLILLLAPGAVNDFTRSACKWTGADEPRLQRRPRSRHSRSHASGALHPTAETRRAAETRGPRGRGNPTEACPRCLPRRTRWSGRSGALPRPPQVRGLAEPIPPLRPTPPGPATRSAGELYVIASRRSVLSSEKSATSQIRRRGHGQGNRDWPRHARRTPVDWPGLGLPPTGARYARSRAAPSPHGGRESRSPP